MFFKQFYLGCLAHASYMIGDTTEACVVDPQRDVEIYIEEAEKQGLEIKYIIETHLHADFVSGHKELAERTGAKVVFSHRAGAQFEHLSVKDGDEIILGKDKFGKGKIKLRILETPGHTPESICILVIDSDTNKARKVLTGDTLFIGDVGRPDLVGAKGYSSEEMATMLYESLHEKLLVLDDDVEVYPAHGAGSLCGKNLSSERSSTIGNQRKFNYALQPMSKKDFVAMMCTDLPEVPAYFPAAVEKNRLGATALDRLPGLKALSPQEIIEKQREGALVIDVRPAAAFGAGHVPGSINIGLSGQFASWAGSLVPQGTAMLIVCDDVQSVEEAITRLARAGHETVDGYLADGILAWRDAGLQTSVIPQWTVHELRDKLGSGEDLQLIDVRRKGEYEDGHAPGAINIPLSSLEKQIASLDPSRTTAIICASGFRSSIATGLLKNAGFENANNITGGTNAWRSEGFKTDSLASTCSGARSSTEPGSCQV